MTLAPAPVYPLALLPPAAVPPAVLPAVVPAIPDRLAVVPLVLPAAAAPVVLPAAPVPREAMFPTFDAPPDDPDTSETVYRDGSGLLLLIGTYPRLVPCFD